MITISISDEYIKEKFKSTSELGPQTSLFLLLLGTADIHLNLFDRKIKQRVNYFNKLSINTKQSIELFPKNIGDDVSWDDMIKYLIFSKYDNISFNKTLLHEYSNYFTHKNNKSHTTAFIYIYRLLEHISFSFPLIYVKKTSDFKSTYDLIKSFFDGNKDKGELGFYKSFINKMYDNDPIKDTSMDFVLSCKDITIQKKIFKTLQKTCDQKIIHENTVDDAKLSIRFDSVSSFIISLRNKFFHYHNNNPQNLSSEDMIYSDLLFKQINEKCLEWISQIFLEILKHNFSELDKISRKVSVKKTSVPYRSILKKHRAKLRHSV